MLTILGWLWKSAQEVFTVRNCFFLAGIGCLGAGLWLQSPSLALTTLGALFIGIWLLTSLKRLGVK